MAAMIQTVEIDDKKKVAVNESTWMPKIHREVGNGRPRGRLCLRGRFNINLTRQAKHRWRY